VRLPSRRLNALTRFLPLPTTHQTGSATVITTYTYDALDRLTIRNYNDGSTPQASYFYDQPLVWGATLTNPIGRLTQTAAAGGFAEAVFSYDPMGRISNQWQCTPVNCGVGAFPVAYTYDLAGNLTSASNGAGVTISYQIDGAGRFTKVTSSLVDAQHPATLFTVDPSIGYFPNGALRKAAFANGLTQSNVYNNRLQPCLLDVNSSNVTLQTCLDSTPAGNVLDLWMGYGSTNNNGNILNWNATGVQSFARTYTYDSLNRLSTLSDSVAAQSCRGATWSYDAWGNRNDQTGTVGTCFNFHQTANAQNRLNGFSYDAAGNLLNDGVHNYTYDAENRITQVDGGGTAAYVYDADGRRVSKVAGSQKDYVYNSEGQVVSEWSPGCGSGCWGAGYVYAGGGMLAQYRNGTTYFVHKDHLGSQRLLTDLSHNNYDSLDFMPFGEQTAGDTGTRFKFTGKERDGESGNDYFGARYYASTMGRFMTSDSARYSGLTDPQSLNLYSYVGNHPTFLIDPDGRCWQWAQKLCDAAHNVGQRFDNLFHGEGFRTDRGVEDNAHRHNAERRQQEVNGSAAGRLGQRYGEFHRNWDRWWAAHDCENNPMGGCGLGPSLASLGVYTRPTRTLFRAVSRAEFEDIQKTGKFRASPGGVESKYFYPTLEQAEKMGGRMYGEDYGVVVGNFPESAMEGPFSVATEGDVFTVPNENLDLARPAVEVPLEPEIPE
jgi:RHS repeat-associated protein